MLFEEPPIHCTVIENEITRACQCTLLVARFDEVHPVISGNKLYKLYYFLQEAMASDHKTILTFGGAYSNHLAATAFACRQADLRSIGIVRGERPAVLSHTLQQCTEHGMELQFVNRAEYAVLSDGANVNNLKDMFGECLVVPEGGYHPIGAIGASRMMQSLNIPTITHICLALGTATTLAGFLLDEKNSAGVIAIPVLKNMTDIDQRLHYLGASAGINRLTLWHAYHFGGYAKKTTELIGFMNELYSEHHLPTDFVYTGKMMYAVMNQLKAGFFKVGSTILCIHTGGLQGNLSLPPGTLVF
jgi:1-aminocyclopropane-1-carboxylate deaminase/D-cysteine desulfhydrase-like pyridoxal-dependent ACC family enzyme